MWNRLSAGLRLLQLSLARACGTPDYDAYLRHECSHHPERTPLGYAEFFRARQDARYGAGGPPRCC
jgi:uncharacterized short protein YbdD (DUF466 family)